MSLEKFINFAAYQIIWLACVMGATRTWHWLGPALALAYAVWYVLRSAKPFAEIRLLLQVMLIGGLFDQLLLSLGWVIYPPSIWSPSLLPVWMWSLWLTFGTTLKLSLGWLAVRPQTAALLGAAGGTLAYLAGTRMGAITWTADVSLIGVIALGYGMLVPGMLKLSKVDT